MTIDPKKMPKQMWIRNPDNTLKLVDTDEMLKAMGLLKDHSNGVKPPPGVEIQPRKAVQPGLGTLLAKTLAAVGIRKKAGCNCGKRQAAMDRATPAWLRPLLAPLVQPSRPPSASAVPAASKR